jgi:hypothetical protein
MNDIAELEDRMRAALRIDADTAPVRRPSPEQFRATLAADSHRPAEPVSSAAPTVARRRRPLLQRGLVAAALIAGVTTGVIAFSASGSSTAFASWISRPGSISASETDDLNDACQESDPSLERPVVVDRRGHSAFAVYDNGSGTTDCLMTVPGETPDKGLPAGWISSQGVAPVAPSAQLPLVVQSAKSREGNSVHGSAVTWVSGRVDQSVADVTVDTVNGTVRASVHDGWFAAWWPGNDGDTAVVHAYSTSGALLETADELSCADDSRPDPRVQLPDRVTTGGCH